MEHRADPPEVLLTLGGFLEVDQVEHRNALTCGASRDPEVVPPGVAAAGPAFRDVEHNGLRGAYALVAKGALIWTPACCSVRYPPTVRVRFSTTARESTPPFW